MPGNSDKDLRYDECNVYHNTMLKTALPTSWRSNWRKPKPFQYLLDQCSSAINNISSSAFPTALGARRREFPRRDNFRGSNDVKFTKNIAKSFADRCRSRLTFKMSNATLSKHFGRRKCGPFTFTKRISSRTTNSSIPNDSRDFCALICCWDRVSTKLLTRDIDDQSFRTVTRLGDFTQRRPETNENDVPEGHSYI